MNRRDILTAAPAFGLAGIMPATAATETPIMRLFREWEGANAKMETAAAEIDIADRKDGDAWDQAWDVRWAIEQRLMAEPCVDCRDWLVKVATWSNYGDGSSIDQVDCPQLWVEARALVGGAA